MKEEIRCVKKTRVEMDCYFLGPFLINGKYAKGEFNVPFITTEIPLLKAINRGRSIACQIEGVRTEIVKNEMTRAPLITAASNEVALFLVEYIKKNFRELAGVVSETTKFGKLTSIYPVIKEGGTDVYLRVGMFCGDAAGHNMSEKGAIAVCQHLESLLQFKGKISLFSISSNFCTDKKISKINARYGRGKWVVASARVPGKIMERRLGVSAKRFFDLHYKKNIVGSELAGIQSGQNSHHANMVAAIFLATGQDLGNVVEGSAGNDFVVCHENGDLTFTVEMPCLILGTLGGGVMFPYAQENLLKIGCAGSGDPPGSNALKFAEIVAAAVWAGEFSTMAELTKGAKFIDDHLKTERG